MVSLSELQQYRGWKTMTLVQFLGWCVAAFSAAALMNFLLKQVSREYVKKLSVKNPDFAASYRSLMRTMIRNHRRFGMAAGILLPVHAGAVLSSGVSSLTGIAAGILLLSVVGTGIYGFYIVRDPRRRWVHAHRGGAFFLCLAAVLHVIFKAYVFF